MDDITIIQVLAMLLIAGGAGFVQTSIGFGFSIVSLPFVLLFMPLPQAVAVLSIVGFLCYFRVVVILRKKIDFRMVTVPLLASIAGRTLGIQFLMGPNIEYVKIVLGVCLLGLSIYFSFYQEKVCVQYNVKNGLFFGFLSGLFAGMFNIGGPPMVLYYMACKVGKETYMATMQMFFTLATVYSVFLHYLYGNLHATTLSFAGLGFVGVFIGGIFGTLVFNKLNVKLFNTAIYLFLAVAGLYTIVDSTIKVL